MLSILETVIPVPLYFSICPKAGFLGGSQETFFFSSNLRIWNRISYFMKGLQQRKGGSERLNRSVGWVAWKKLRS